MTRILIVEDEQHLADGLRFNLEAECYDTEVVDSGEAALDRLARDRPSGRSGGARRDAAGLNGFEVAARLREQGATCPS